MTVLFLIKWMWDRCKIIIITIIKCFVPTQAHSPEAPLLPAMLCTPKERSHLINPRVCNLPPTLLQSVQFTKLDHLLTSAHVFTSDILRAWQMPGTPKHTTWSDPPLWQQRLVIIFWIICILGMTKQTHHCHLKRVNLWIAMSTYRFQYCKNWI